MAIDNGSQKLSYEYNTRGRIIKQRANGVDIVFTYDKLGRLKTKCLGSVKMPISKIEYFYGANNQIAAREVNGVKQEYAYDALGQLLSVAAGGKVLEQYKYDPAGNMLSKTIDGKVTTYKYDASNQLVSSTTDGKTTDFEYDAAGRMIQEGSTFYRYNFNNKVVKSGNNTYNYYASGQIANASVNGKNEEFSWDGLALLERNGTNYLNEPYVTGGNPVLAGKDVLFNDLLGTTQGSISKNGKYQPSNTTAFGAGDKSAFFTGKPYVEGLGSVFLFRNYRPELSKWTSSDPLGYPDGWNNLAYVNNMVTRCYDWQGTETQYYTGHQDTITVNLYSGNPSTQTDPGIIFNNLVDPFPQAAIDQINAAVSASITSLNAGTILSNAGITYTSIGNITATYTTNQITDYSGSSGNFMVISITVNITYSIAYEE